MPLPCDDALKTICSSGNNSSAEVRADPLLAEELNTFYGRFECNGGSVTLKKKKKEKVFNLFFFSLETTIELSIYPVSVSELAYELSPSSVVTREDTDELSVFPASVPHMLSLGAFPLHGTVRYGSVRVGLHFHRSLVPL